MVERKAAMSNGVMVDHCLSDPAAYEVVQTGGDILNCNLVFADCNHNNNKFYIIQGLKKGNFYYLWTRWGRVGVDGQTAMIPCSNEKTCVSKYHSKAKQK